VAFVGNEAPSGGGLSVQSSQVAAVNCRFLGNQGQFGGGAFVQSSTGTASLTNCVFSGNTVSDGSTALGGGLCVVDDGTATVTNSTFSGNTAQSGKDAWGGGIYIESSTANITNAIVWGNVADVEPGIYAGYSSTLTVTYSCVQYWASGGTGNTASDPLLADPEGVDNALGTADDDVRLTSGSSAIDTASDAAVPDDDFDLDRNGDTSEPLPWDLGREDRFLGTGTTVDMGAYEYLNTGDDLGDPEPPAAGAP